ncbi:hypothetical protein RhiirC2_800461, partial [Rhizophagus irregularis]
RFQEETPDEGSNRQRGRIEEESNPNQTSDKTNKSASKSSPTKLYKQKQQRFQEETPSEGSKRQQGRMEEESDLNEMSDKTNKSTSKSAPIKSILKSAKSTKPTQEESDNKVIEIELPNIPKDVIGNEKMIWKYSNSTKIRIKNLKLKKQIDEVQVENAKLQRENNRLFDKNHFLTRKESGEEGSGSNNNNEYDEKEARTEMKSILKIINETQGLDYNEMFNSVKNLKIHRKLVPKLHSAFASCFPALNKTFTKWLGCLHKSHHSHKRLMDRGKADENKHWVHSNN